MGRNGKESTLREGLSEAMENLLKELYRAEAVGAPDSAGPESLEEFVGRQRTQGHWGSAERLERMWREQDWKTGTKRLAGRLGVTPSAVSQLVGKLSTLGLVEREAYRPPTLTEAGRRVAKEMVRHHRLLELFLTETVGFSEADAHPEAERLEHHISEALEAAIADRLDHPTHDPHGSPIPDAGLEMPATGLVPLSLLQRGERAAVRRVAGFDAGLLRHLSASGLEVGAVVEVLRVEKFGVGFVRGVEGREEEAHLSLEAAAQVGVEKRVAGRPLSSLSAGERAEILSLGPDALASRLRDMGLAVGEEVRVVRRAPLGDPLEVEAGDTRLALREQDARQITVGGATS